MTTVERSSNGDAAAEETRQQQQEEEQALSLLAFGSCNKQGLKQPLWQVIAAMKPEAWIWTGDSVYSNEPGRFEQVSNANSGPANLRRNCSQLVSSDLLLLPLLSVAVKSQTQLLSSGMRTAHHPTCCLFLLSCVLLSCNCSCSRHTPLS